MQQVSLGQGSTQWVLLDADRVTGQGQVAPRLCFQMRARTPREQMDVGIHLMHAELRTGVECLGHGFVTGIPLSHGERYITLEVPVSRQALDHLEAIAPEDRIDLELKLTGWLHARDNNEDGPRFTSSPQPGEWVFQSFGEANQALLPFQVARSDWFTHVLQPIGTVEYISTEIVLPSGDPLLRAAVNQIREAENAYSMHNDPAVFLHCRGAIDALPGAKQDIFAGLGDRDEAKLLDSLTREAGQYLHHGRHIATDGAEQGDFPVTHQDARFALNLTKLLIAHISHVLSS
jgi:hypothetical protein